MYPQMVSFLCKITMNKYCGPEDIDLRELTGNFGHAPTFSRCVVDTQSKYEMRTLWTRRLIDSGKNEIGGTPLGHR